MKKLIFVALGGYLWRKFTRRSNGVESRARYG